MAYRHLEIIVQNSWKYIRRKQNGGMHLRFLSYEKEEIIYPSDWCEKAFVKLKKLSQILKDMDLIDGKLYNVSDDSRVFDSRLQAKMLAFKSLSQEFLGCPDVQEAMRKNIMAEFGCKEYASHALFFAKPCERGPLSVNSLTKVADILHVSAQQRKVVRHKILPQVTQHQIWTGALREILYELRTEIDHQNRENPSKETRMAHQVVATCLEFIDIAISYDLESTSWMKLAPSKGTKNNGSHKWEEVLEMFVDLINCLNDQKEYAPLVTKLEIMKEGLYQIRTVLMDKDIGYKETRHHENLVQKKLIKTLGHSSRCLFTLLLYYLYGGIRNIEVEVSGGFYPLEEGKDRFVMCMGKFLTSDQGNMVMNGVKQLDRALGLFKFVWETAEVKGDLKVLGHLWCIGAQNRCITYKGNAYLVHGIN